MPKILLLRHIMTVINNESYWYFLNNLEKGPFDRSIFSLWSHTLVTCRLNDHLDKSPFSSNRQLQITPTCNDRPNRFEYYSLTEQNLWYFSLFSPSFWSTAACRTLSVHVCYKSSVIKSFFMTKSHVVREWFSIISLIKLVRSLLLSQKIFDLTSIVLT